MIQDKNPPIAKMLIDDGITTDIPQSPPRQKGIFKNMNMFMMNITIAISVQITMSWSTQQRIGEGYREYKYPKFCELPLHFSLHGK